jgi:hypothetical protein
VGHSGNFSSGGGAQIAPAAICANDNSGGLGATLTPPATALPAMPRVSGASAAATKPPWPEENPEAFIRSLTGLPPVPALGHGGGYSALGLGLGVASRASTADAIAAAARVPAGASALAARVAGLGAYPLATRERVQVATLERLEREQVRFLVGALVTDCD